MEIIFFVVETKNINLLSGVASLALALVQINTGEHMCFTIDNMKSGNVQKEDMKANETKIYPARLRHITGKYKKEDFQNKIGKINNYSVKLHIYPSVVRSTCCSDRTTNSLSFA